MDRYLSTLFIAALFVSFASPVLKEHHERQGLQAQRDHSVGEMPLCRDRSFVAAHNVFAISTLALGSQP